MNSGDQRYSDPRRDEYETRQQAQFEDRPAQQAGDAQADYARTGNRQFGEPGLGDRWDERPYGRSAARRQRETGDYGNYARQDRDGLGDDERAYLAERRGRGRSRDYGRFTSESYGGRDYAYPGDPGYAMTPTGGFGGITTGTGYGGYPSRNARDRYYDEDRRPFLDRAGDEIASWFGNEEAARRREIDHRGIGPQGYTRSDERILEDACDHLTEDRFVDASNISVSVSDREVTLDGMVDRKAAKRRAEDCVDQVIGVSHVQNNLRIADRDK